MKRLLLAAVAALGFCGAAHAAGSVSVCDLAGKNCLIPNSSGGLPFTSAATGVSSASFAGTTSGTANTFTTALAANGARQGCLVQNNSTATEYVYFGSGAATVAASYQLSPGGAISCNTGSIVLQDAVQIAANAASSTYAGFNQ